MKSLKQILLSHLKKLKEKRGYNMLNTPDSVWSRSSGHRKTTKGDGGAGNDQQASGADIAAKMDFDVAPQTNINDKEPFQLMDLVFQAWGFDKPGPDKDEPEKDRDEKKQNVINRKLQGK